ncbi:hypothetical protein BH23ACT3_BH23ACT3_10250 [soil metagenome]
MGVVSFIDAIVERKIAEAIERGEFDAGPLRGKPIPDLDRPRQPGWWAEQFVRRERSHVEREAALDECDAWERRFRVARTLDELDRLRDEATAWVDATNRHLLPHDAFDHFSIEEHERRLGRH